jgi:2-haloacid dehalogenase
MSEPDIDAVVFDVLGTLVDEPAGIRAGIRELDPSLDDPRVEQLLSLWQQYIDREQRRILDGARPYLTSDVLDLEAARLVADAAGVDDPTAVAALALSSRRLPPWPDTVAGLARLAERFPLIGLSNASRTALLGLRSRISTDLGTCGSNRGPCRVIFRRYAHEGGGECPFVIVAR